MVWLTFLDINSIQQAFMRGYCVHIFGYALSNTKRRNKKKREKVNSWAKLEEVGALTRKHYRYNKSWNVNVNNYCAIMNKSA